MIAPIDLKERDLIRGEELAKELVALRADLRPVSGARPPDLDQRR